MDIILYAVPFFFALIAVELIADRVKATHHYRLSDSLTSLSTGTLSQLMGIIHLLIPFTAYIWLYQNYALFEITHSPWNWVWVFVLYDLAYYWKHRFGHEINIMWAAHVVHHSSEEFNLSTALRQTSGSNIGFLIYLPLAVLGIDPVMLATVGGLNLVYQYWVHTQHIDKLGWMEKVFVTPSNHRGHHAQNTVYIDRNYGGVFILWDRLFGTYQPELDDDKPVFGIRGALASWNPLWANLQIFSQLARDCYHTKNWWHKFSLWFRRTGWRPPDVVERFPVSKLEDLSGFQKFDVKASTSAKWYATVQYILHAGVSLFLLLNINAFSLTEMLSYIALLTLGSWSMGAVLESKANAIIFDFLKYIALVLLSILAASAGFTMQAFIGVCALVSIAVVLYAALLGPPLHTPGDEVHAQAL